MKTKNGSGAFLGRITRGLFAIAVALLGVGNAVAAGEPQKTRAQECLEEIFDVANTPTTVEPVYNEDGNLTGHKVTLGRDYESLALATDLGDVMIDLNGWTISGTNGVNGTTTAGGKGGAAIVVAGECGSDTGATAITVTNIPPVCVQLWENGPYFAQSNVGATKPEESGYYFWWGDTVGYTNSGSAWVSTDGNGTIIRFDENESPANSTYKKAIEELYDNGNGYIDANGADGKLKPEHDAATAHLDAPWRMMTDAELQKLVDTDIATRVCTSVWTTCNGVDGRRVFGITPGHEGLSIFLPATGFGSSTYILSRRSGSYWSSLPKDKTSAWSLGFDSDGFSRKYSGRYFGFLVRPVRDSAYADGRPVSGPAAAIVGGNGGDGNPAGKGSPAVVDESGAAVAVDDPMGLVKNGTDGINRAAEWVFREIFGEPSVVNTVVTNGVAAYTKVTLGQDYGPLAFSTDLGAVTLDLNGWTIRGTNGVNGTATTAGGNGGAAITVAGTCGAAAGTTAITVINNGATDGVQLWEGGPYFAECNVGATKPEESGSYFWWGDTVGYVRNASNNGWVSVDGKGKTIKFSSTDTTANQTYGKDDDTLKSEGWIDESGNLVAAHDAATAHLGAPWRMMTDAELKMLVDEDVCQYTWTGNWEGTGKKGYVIKGKTAGYTDKSVFFPAAGCGDGSNLSAESCGFYWSLATSSKFAWYLWFDWEDFMRLNSYRYYGCSVRPVRGFDTGRPAVGPSAAIVGGNGGDGNPAGKGSPAIVDESGAAVAVTDPKGFVKNGTGGPGGSVLIVLPTGLAGYEYVVSNLTAGAEAEIAPTETVAGGASYELPIGVKVAIYCVPAAGYIVSGTNPYVIEEVMAETTVRHEDLPKAEKPVPPQPDEWLATGTVKYPKPVKNTKYLKAKSTATWKAKADAGCVFTGWTPLDGAKIPAAYGLLSENELKSPTLKLMIAEGETDILTNFVAATWAWIDEDRLGAVTLTPSNLVVESKSYVTATVSGLPGGLKFNRKTLKIVQSGNNAPKDTTAPKQVKVSVKNASGYTFKQVYKVSVKDGVMTEPEPVDDKFNARTGEPVVLRGDALLGKVTGSKVYVAGKKATVKATPAKNCIFLGWYKDAAFANAATNLLTDYRAASQKIEVTTNVSLYARFVALEGWTVGTFDGVYYEDVGGTNVASGTVTLTVSNKGKVSGKTLVGGKSYSFKANALDDAVETEAAGLVFVAHPTVKVDGAEKTLELRIFESMSTGLGAAEILYGEEEDAPFAEAVQNGWKLKPSALPAFPTGKAAIEVSVTNGVDLTLKFGAKGVVKAAGAVGGAKVSVKSQVLPVELANEKDPLAYRAQTCVYAPKAGFCEVYDLMLEAEQSGTQIKDVLILSPEEYSDYTMTGKMPRLPPHHTPK